jgi:hypothetical protein
MITREEDIDKHGVVLPGLDGLGDRPAHRPGP